MKHCKVVGKLLPRLVAVSLSGAWQESKSKGYEWFQWQRFHQTLLWYRALWEEGQSAAGPDLYFGVFAARRQKSTSCSNIVTDKG